MEPFDASPPVPLTQAEAQSYRDQAAKGVTPPLSIVRRFIATIRKNIDLSPTKTAQAKKTRVKAAPVDENQFTAF